MKLSMTQAIKILFITIILSIFMVGCSSEESSKKDDGKSDKPKDGGTITIAMTQEPETLDVHKSSMTSTQNIASKMGGGLLTVDPKTLEIIPYLAEDYKVSDDGLKLEFKIRKGVTFHDGTALTSKSFKETFDRALNPATQSKNVAYYLANVKTINAPDDSTLVIELKSPSVPFLRSLTYGGWLQPYSMETISESGDEFGRNPVGVGPYKFESWKTGNEIVLAKNKDFKWAESFFENKGAAHPDKIVYKMIKDVQTIVAALNSGSIDIADVPAKDIAKFKNNDKFQVLESLGQGLGLYLELNTKNTHLQNQKVRQALNMAVNKEAVIKAVLQGEGVPVNGPLPPTVFGYDSTVEEYGYGFNIEEAKKLLEQAGYRLNQNGVLEKDGKELSLKLASLPQWSLDAQLLQGMYKEIGVKVEIQNYEAGALVAAVTKGQFDMTVMAWTADDPSILSQRFHSSQIGVGNFSQVNDPSLDTLLVKGQTTMDQEERKHIYAEIQRHIVDKAYWVPVYTQKVFTVVNKRVQGIELSKAGSLLYHDSWVSE
ncbi:ABC transporter substrate-binding protein [Bacillus massilinigeriensis]|uniref:ABC transporter substrate-binding protein n=1 Tax=Bacillus massilionigeriensis TaxID=1805475 RepID=UPI00096B1BA4|nr:ABC transporter substrate-binding protein [Bacillus massilionigeriensis]